MAEIDIGPYLNLPTAMAAAADSLDSRREVFITGTSGGICRALELSEFLKERIPDLYQLVSLESQGGS
jgi:hypothetical protein